MQASDLTLEGKHGRPANKSYPGAESGKGSENGAFLAVVATNLTHMIIFCEIASNMSVSDSGNRARIYLQLPVVEN